MFNKRCYRPTDKHNIGHDYVEWAFTRVTLWNVECIDDIYDRLMQGRVFELGKAIKWDQREQVGLQFFLEEGELREETEDVC